MTLHENIHARVSTPDGETDSFKITAGLLQGDTLSPFLFVIVLDYAMRTALKGKEELGFMLIKRLRRRHPAVTITCLIYADDIAIITNQIRLAQEFLTFLYSYTFEKSFIIYINKKYLNKHTINISIIM